MIYSMNKSPIQQSTKQLSKQVTPKAGYMTPRSQKSVSSGKSGRSKSIKNRTKTQSNDIDEDILVKACCPNCRYIFKVVNQNKLNAIKNKLKKLDTIQQQKSDVFNSKNMNVKGFTDPNNKNKKSTPKFQKEFKNINNFNIANNQFPPKTPHKNQKTDKDKMSQISNQNQNIKQDIRLMKNCLGQYQGNREKYSKSHNASIILNNFPVIQVNKSQINYQNQRQKQRINLNQGIQKFSSIRPPKKQVNISKKCQKCKTGSVQTQICFYAAKYKLAQQQLALVANNMQRQPNTPSYVKCLQLILQNQSV